MKCGNLALQKSTRRWKCSLLVVFNFGEWQKSGKNTRVSARLGGHTSEANIECPSSPALAHIVWPLFCLAEIRDNPQSRKNSISINYTGDFVCSTKTAMKPWKDILTEVTGLIRITTEYYRTICASLFQSVGGRGGFRWREHCHTTLT